MNISQDTRPVFLRLAFRPFFFFAAAFSALAISVWTATLSGALVFNPYGGSQLWHAHEMLFGYTAAVAVGFLLTAVQNWTGVKSISGGPLALLFISWLIPRLLLALPAGSLPDTLLLSDLLFLPLSAYFLSRPIIAAKKFRNLFFVPILLLMFIANVTFHIGIDEQNPVLSQQGLYGIVWLITLLMTVLGGRVFPMFTANGTQTQKVMAIPSLEKGVIGGTVICALLVVGGLHNSTDPLIRNVTSILLITVGALHAYRLFRWRPHITLRTPLLWSLHGAYGFIPLGFILMGISIHDPSMSFSTALHCIMAGAMGAMTVSMMSRVSLGHTGRMLEAQPIMSLAFALILFAALIRTIAIWLLPQLTNLWWLIAGSSWVLGFLIFCLCYWDVLSKPRIDGKAG